jgi:hypothetical protein
VESLFTNPHSNIPDDLWKISSPVQRHAAATDYWNSLTGLQKIAGKSIRKRLVDFFARDSTPDQLSALAGAGIVGGMNLRDTRTVPQDQELDVGGGRFTREPTREQLDLRASRASLNEQKARGESGAVSEKLQDLKERLANIKAQNRALSTALATAAGGAIGYGLARRTRAAM